MATTINKNHNTYSTTVTNGTVPGDAATGHFIRYIDDWVEALEPYDTPLLTAIGVGGAVDQRKVEWGQSRQTGHASTLASSYTAAGTSLVVATGTGVRFQPYNVVKVLAEGANTDEIFLVSSISTDTLTVVGAQGGTSASDHASGATVEIIGVALPQNTDFPKGPVTFGDMSYNYFQRFATGVQMDDAERVTPNLEISGDQLLTHMATKAKDLKLLLEKAIIRGGRQAGTVTSPSMLGGVPTFVTTNVTDLGGNLLSLYDLETELRDLWNAVGMNAKPKLLMSMNTAAIIDSMPNAYREATLQDTSASLVFNSVQFRTGRYEFMVSRWIPDGQIWGIDTGAMKVHPYKGLNWHTKQHQTDGDHSWHSISGDFTLTVKKEHTMFLLKNFNSDLSNYPRQGFL